MYYPRSLTNVILTCFVLSTVPVVIALAELAFGLDDLAKRSQLSVREAEAASTASRELRDLTGRIERAVRQSLILEDPALIDGYRKLDVQLEQTLVRSQTLPLTEDERNLLKKAGGERAKLANSLRDGITPELDRGALINEAADLADTAAQAATALGHVTEREVITLREMAASTRENWPWLLGGAALIALLLAISFSMLIARPLNRIDQSIRKLGRGDFNEPIKIRGPRDLRSLGERLDWLRRRLLELETHQTRFLRHVSHELKTPLTAVREGSELLHDRVVGEMSAQQSDVVRIIRDNTVSLQHLIEDLLSYQQHKSAIQLKVEPIELRAVIERVVSEHRLAMLARAISATVTCEAITLYGDREQIRVILDNLVSNAIKYTPRGGTIRIGAKIIAPTIADTPATAQIDVEDDGPGIALEEQERVFDSFYRGDAAASSKVMGSGLGLAIVREYVHAHQGQVFVVEPGTPGGRFRVQLPIDATQLALIDQTTAFVAPTMMGASHAR